MTPTIENPGQLKLPDGTDEILKKMFAAYGRVVIKAELGGGLSGGWVFLVRPIGLDGDPPTLSKVVKIASVSLIQKEVQAYHKHVLDKWPRAATLWGKPIMLPDRERGGLCYTLVGEDLDEPVSLHSYCQQAAVEDIRFVLAEQLMPIIEKLTRHSQPQAEFNLRRSYDTLLPMNLWLEPGPIPAGTTPKQIRPTSPPDDLAVGDYARLEGFAVSKVDEVNDTVTLNQPRDHNEQHPVLTWSGSSPAPASRPISLIKKSAPSRAGSAAPAAASLKQSCALLWVNHSTWPQSGCRHRTGAVCPTPCWPWITYSKRAAMCAMALYTAI